MNDIPKNAESNTVAQSSENKENSCGKSCESGAGMPEQDKSVMPQSQANAHQASQPFTDHSATAKPEKSRHEEKNKSTKPSGHSLEDKIIDLWSDHLKLGELVFKAPRKELDRVMTSWSDEQKAHVMSCLEDGQEAEWKIVAIRNMPDQFNHDSVTKLIKDWKPGLRKAIWHIMTPQEREVECFRQINPNGDLGNAQELGLFKLE